MRYEIDISRGRMTLADNDGELLMTIRGSVVEDDGIDWINLTLSKQQTEELLMAVDLIKSQRPKDKQETMPHPFIQYPPGVRGGSITYNNTTDVRGNTVDRTFE